MKNKVFAFPDLLMLNFVPQGIQLSLMFEHAEKFNRTISNSIKCFRFYNERGKKNCIGKK